MVQDRGTERNVSGTSILSQKNIIHLRVEFIAEWVCVLL